jgi:hypothetical protein
MSLELRLRQACFPGGDGILGGGVGEGSCNYSTYYNPTTGQEVNIPFVPCGQAYTEDEVITILGENMTVLGE